MAQTRQITKVESDFTKKPLMSVGVQPLKGYGGLSKRYPDQVHPAGVYRQPFSGAFFAAHTSPTEEASGGPGFATESEIAEQMDMEYFRDLDKDEDDGSYYPDRNDAHAPGIQAKVRASAQNAVVVTQDQIEAAQEAAKTDPDAVWGLLGMDKPKGARVETLKPGTDTSPGPNDLGPNDTGSGQPKADLDPPAKANTKPNPNADPNADIDDMSKGQMATELSKLGMDVDKNKFNAPALKQMLIDARNKNKSEETS